MSDDETTLEIAGLENLIKAFKGKLPTVRVGILAGSSRNPAEGSKAKNLPTNATVGAIYEYRLDPSKAGGSFLRVPIADNLQKYLEKAGAFDESVIKKIIKQKSLIPHLEKVGAISEQIVHDGFETGGFGKWTPSNMELKKNHQTLVETQQLRNSITSEVKE